MYGPVPGAGSDSILSRFFSIQPGSPIIKKKVRAGRIGSGCFVTRSIVRLSTTLALARVGKYRRPSAVVPSAVSRLTASSTAFAVNGSPFENFTPSCSLKRQVVSFVRSQLFASRGTISFVLLSRPTRLSYTLGV